MSVYTITRNFLNHLAQTSSFLELQGEIENIVEAYQQHFPGLINTEQDAHFYQALLTKKYERINASNYSDLESKDYLLSTIFKFHYFVTVNDIITKNELQTHKFRCEKFFRIFNKAYLKAFVKINIPFVAEYPTAAKIALGDIFNSIEKDGIPPLIGEID